MESMNGPSVIKTVEQTTTPPLRNPEWNWPEFGLLPSERFGDTPPPPQLPVWDGPEFGPSADGVVYYPG